MIVIGKTERFFGVKEVVRVRNVIAKYCLLFR